MYGYVEVAQLRVMKVNDRIEVFILTCARVVVKGHNVDAAIAELVGDRLNNAPDFVDLVLDAVGALAFHGVTGRYDDPIKSNRHRAARRVWENNLDLVVGLDAEGFHRAGRNIGNAPGVPCGPQSAG